MSSGTWLRIWIWALGGLLAVMTGGLILDSGGPVLRADGTILSTQFVEGMTTTTYIKTGDVEVPIQTQLPGVWIAEVDSAELGKVEVPIDSDKFHRGEKVYLDYYIGRLSGRASVVELHPQSESVVEH